MGLELNLSLYILGVLRVDTDLHPGPWSFDKYPFAKLYIAFVWSGQTADRTSPLEQQNAKHFAGVL